MPSAILTRYAWVMKDKGRDAEVRRAAHGRLLRHAQTCPDTLVIDESRLANAPKVQQYQAEDGPSDVWERKADGYWKRSAARAPDEPSGVRHE